MACKNRQARSPDVEQKEMNENNPLFKEHKLILIIKAIKEWLDKKPTGMLKLEIHARDGGISKIYKDNREEIVE